MIGPKAPRDHEITLHRSGQGSELHIPLLHCRLQLLRSRLPGTHGRIAPSYRLAQVSLGALHLRCLRRERCLEAVRFRCQSLPEYAVSSGDGKSTSTTERAGRK